MIRRNLDHLLETAARGFVIQVVQRFVSFGAQSIQARLLVLGRYAERKEEEERHADEFHVRQDYKITEFTGWSRDSYQTAIRRGKCIRFILKFCHPVS